MSESGPGGRFDETGRTPSGAGGGGQPPGDVARWLDRWRQRLPAGALMPEHEARFVIEAVLEDLGGGRPEHLDRAGRAWGRAHRSVSEMVGRLSLFREALAATGVDDALRMHRALDRVTAAATEEVLQRLERASRTDALTGVGNRRAFDETLSAALSAAARQGHEVTVVAIDLDGLKRVNDTEGHAAGDAALLAIVRAIYTALRDEDTVFRVGGDEFVVLLPFTSVQAAELLMERVRAGGAPAFTWGAAGFPGAGTDARHLMEAADRELYRRRQAGREGRLVPLPAVTPAAPGARPRRDALRWAWIPAAAVLVLSLVASLVSGSEPGRRSAVRQPSGPVTQPGGASAPGARGGVAAPAEPGAGGAQAGAGAQPGTASGGPGRGASAVVTTSATGTPPPSSSGSPGSGPPPPPGGPAPPPTSPPPGQGGVLGVLENLLAPVPGVGGSNGLIATVGQVVGGGSTAPPTTVTAAPTPGPGPALPASTAGGAPGAAGGGSAGSLLGVLNGML